MSRRGGERFNFERPYVRKDLLDLFQKEVNKAGYCGTSLKTDSWNRIINAMKSTYNKEFDQKQLKNQWDYLRDSYLTWTRLENKTGHGYNAETGRFDWPDHVWEDMIKKYPKTKKFRYKPLEDREALKELFGTTLATGVNAFSPAHQLPKENPRNEPAIEVDEEELIGEEETNTLSPGNPNDYFFTDYRISDEPPLTNTQEHVGQSDSGSSRAKKRHKSSGPVEDPMAKDFHDLIQIIKNDHGAKGNAIAECSDALRELADLGKLDEATLVKAKLAFCKNADFRSFFLTSKGDDEKLAFIKGMLGSD